MSITSHTTKKRARATLVPPEHRVRIEFSLAKRNTCDLLRLLDVAFAELVAELPVLCDAAAMPQAHHEIGNYTAHIAALEDHPVLAAADDLVIDIFDKNADTACVRISFETRDSASVGRLIRLATECMPEVEAVWSAFNDSDYCVETKRYRPSGVWFASVHFPPAVSVSDTRDGLYQHHQLLIRSAAMTVSSQTHSSGQNSGTAPDPAHDATGARGTQCATEPWQ